jgi:hypothetical protein
VQPVQCGWPIFAERKKLMQMTSNCANFAINENINTTRTSLAGEEKMNTFE